MTRIRWGDTGRRFFEAGVSHGVLYLPGIPGVPWDGLISVKLNEAGGEPRSYFIDGQKYANIPSRTEFGATLEAFSSPKEFDSCDGVASAGGGLHITNQPRKPFNLTYRTLKGNDTEGTSYGYKIHLVYNCLAAPADRTYSTLDKSADAGSLSWTLSSLAPSIANYRPTSHFVIDSTETNETVLAYLEDILYGLENTMPRMPTIDELFEMFSWRLPPVSKPINRLGEASNEVAYIRNLVKSPRLGDLAVSGITDEFVSSTSTPYDGSYSGYAYPYPFPDVTIEADYRMALFNPLGGLTRNQVRSGSILDVTPVPGKWYGALVWAGNSGSAYIQANRTFVDLEFTNPGGDRVVSDGYGSIAGRMSSSPGSTTGLGVVSKLLGQAQEGDTDLTISIMMRDEPEGDPISSGRFMWSESWCLYEGDTQEEVQSLLDMGFFSGDYPAFIAKSQLLTPVWTGTRNDSVSEAPYYVALAEPGEIGDLWLIDGVPWVFTDNLIWETNLPA